MTNIAQTSNLDELSRRREQRIDDAYCRLQAATNPEERRRAWGEMRHEISRRSAQQVRRMEHGMGLNGEVIQWQE